MSKPAGPSPAMPPPQRWRLHAHTRVIATPAKKQLPAIDAAGSLQHLTRFKETIVITSLTRLLGIVLLAGSLGACSSMSTRDKNTAAGAAIGGVAGSVLTGGSTVGTLGGAVVGGVIGNRIDKDKK